MYQKLLAPLLYQRENKDGHREADLGGFSMEAKEQVGEKGSKRDLLSSWEGHREAELGGSRKGLHRGFVEEPQRCS